MDEIEGLLGCVAVFCFVGAALALEVLINMWLWNWIIVGLFHAEPISWIMGVGISLVLGLITIRFTNKSNKD